MPASFLHLKPCVPPFLGELALAHAPGYDFVTSSQMPFSQPADIDPLPPPAAVSLPPTAVQRTAGISPACAKPGSGAIRSDSSRGINMTAVAAARNSLQSKLDRNRKVRPAKIDELSASMDLVDHNADQNFAVSWDDSFIMGKDSGNPEIRKALRF